jgi:very-short-patch-repair endonuclease
VIDGMIDKGQSLNSPPLQGRGRGWGVSVRQLATMHDRAHIMRRNPTEPEKRLWRALSGSKLGGHKFRRQSVIGGAIVDFLCPQKALIVEIDGDTHFEDSDADRDSRLVALGYRIARFGNADVMNNLEGVCAHLLVMLNVAPDRWNGPHPNPSPEGEGLEEE